MASFDQAFLAVDVSLVSGDSGRAVTWSVYMSTRVWRSKADEDMDTMLKASVEEQ